jgi:hypothetical protein
MMDKFPCPGGKEVLLIVNALARKIRIDDKDL